MSFDERFALGNFKLLLFKSVIVLIGSTVTIYTGYVSKTAFFGSNKRNLFSPLQIPQKSLLTIFSRRLYSSQLESNHKGGFQILQRNTELDLTHLINR